MSVAIERALEVARRRHVLIAAGDSDAYAGLDGELNVACDALLGPGAAFLTDADLPLLDELIALETQSLRMVQAMLVETGARMESLGQSRRANGAYARSERFSVNGV